MTSNDTNIIVMHLVTICMTTFLCVFDTHPANIAFIYVAFNPFSSQNIVILFYLGKIYIL